MSSIFDLFNDDFFKYVIDDGQRESSRLNELRCPGCGMTYNHFNRTGKFGCGQCYDTFDSYVKPLVKRIHGSLDYEGNVPMRGTGVFRTKHQIKRMRQELQQAVAQEDFERAMVLRDQIKALEDSIKE